MLKYSMFTTKEMTVYIDDCSYGAFIHGGYLYYMDHGDKSFTIFRKNLDTDKVEIMFGDGVGKRDRDYIGDSPYYDNFVIVNDVLYASSRFPAKIWRYDEGTGAEVVDCGGNSIGKMIAYNGKIYFSMYNEGSGYDGETPTFSIFEYDTNIGNLTRKYDAVEGDASRFEILNGYFLARVSYDSDYIPYKIK